jgi:hypothetical protein
MVAPAQVAAVRHRLAGTTWEWEPGKSTLSLKTDGTVAASWLPDATGRWYVNPDLTVVWWCTGHPWATVMKFNENYTAHESVVPKHELPRAGKRIK